MMLSMHASLTDVAVSLQQSNAGGAPQKAAATDPAAL